MRGSAAAGAGKDRAVPRTVDDSPLNMCSTAAVPEPHADGGLPAWVLDVVPIGCSSSRACSVCVAGAARR